MLKDNFQPSSSGPFDPIAKPVRHPDDQIPRELLPGTAKKAIRSFSPRTFKLVCELSLEEGLISGQEISKEFGINVRRTLRKDRLPPPDVCLGILAYIAKKDPEEAKGEEQEWKHATPRPKPKRERQP